MNEIMTRQEELKLHQSGSARSYGSGCRGPLCQREHASTIGAERVARRAYVAEHGLPDYVQHGASAYTNWGCRCGECREGHNEESARYRV